MVSASRYEREFVSWASRIGLVARTAASGVLNTIVGDLIIIPHRSYQLPPIIVEVKSTHFDRFYTSKHMNNLRLMVSLSREFGFIPLLAVRFIGKGWRIVDLRGGIPYVVLSEDTFFLPRERKTLADWLADPSPDRSIMRFFSMNNKGGDLGGAEP